MVAAQGPRRLEASRRAWCGVQWRWRGTQAILSTIRPTSAFESGGHTPISASTGARSHHHRPSDGFAGSCNGLDCGLILREQFGVNSSMPTSLVRQEAACRQAMASLVTPNSCSLAMLPWRWRHITGAARCARRPTINTYDAIAGARRTIEAPKSCALASQTDWGGPTDRQESFPGGRERQPTRTACPFTSPETPLPASSLIF